MHLYSYHTYGKTGYDLRTSVMTLQESVNNDTKSVNEIPVIISEHNTHLSGDWDKLESTPDDIEEAARLASQIIYLVSARITSHYIFKFSITPSFSALRDITKTGLHWGEISLSPFHLSDTTLSAEAVRLLTNMKRTTIYQTSSNETSKYRMYLGSKNGDTGYYFNIVNDKNDFVKLLIDLSQWNIEEGAQIVVETAGTGYWGEVSELLKAPKSGEKVSLNLTPFSTTRLTIPKKVQTPLTSFADLSCTLRAGALSNQADCHSSSIYAGTSNTIEHETTSISLIKFALRKEVPMNQNSILKIKVDEVIGNSDVTA